MMIDSTQNKILITGGLGYIGSHTAVVFAQAGFDIIIIDNLSNSHIDVLGKIEDLSGKKMAFYDIDLRDLEKVKQVFNDNKDIIGVIHFAAKKAIGESCQDPFLYYENNLIGTINLLKAMSLQKIKNIVFSSTASIYDGINSIPPFSEQDEINPSSPYGTTKLASEYILKDLSLCKDFNVVILRYFNPIGAHHSGKIGENPKGVPGNLVPFVYKVAKGEIENVSIFGNDYNTKDGTGIRDYLHVVDLAEAHLLAIQYINEFVSYKDKNTETKKGLYDKFNIGVGEGHSVKEIISLVEKVTEIKIASRVVARRDGDIGTMISNPQKARQILGREPKRSVYQAIEDGRRFTKNN